MVFELLNNHQRKIAGASILVLGIVQISWDSWTLYKLQEHEGLTVFIVGQQYPSLKGLTYRQALPMFHMMKGMLYEDVYQVLETLKISTVLGLVAGILQLFSSSALVLWKGLSVEITWLVMNFISGILLAVAMAYTGVYMIPDVLYMQLLLTVTTVNLFILLHIWVINLIAVVYSTCIQDKSDLENIDSSSTDQSSMENIIPASSVPPRTPRNSNAGRTSQGGGGRVTVAPNRAGPSESRTQRA